MARASSIPQWDEATSWQWQNLTPVWLPMDLPLPASARRRSSAAHAHAHTHVDPQKDRDDSSALHSAGERRASYSFGLELGDQEAIVTWTTAIGVGLCVAVDSSAADAELEISDADALRPALPCYYTCNFASRGAPCGRRFAHILEFLNHLRFRHWATHCHAGLSNAELVRGGVPLEYCGELRRMVDVTLGRFPLEFAYEVELELPDRDDSQ